MANASGQQYGVGLRRAVIFELDSSGYPLAPGTAAYEGLEATGPKVFTVNQPDVRKITHVGADRALALDFLPAIEAPTAELRIAADDLVLNAALSNVNTFNVGEATLVPWSTDQQGYEPDVALLMFQQSLDMVSGLRRWRFYMVPKARAIPMPGNMDENPAEARYAIAPTPTTKHIWGATITSGSEGATEAGYFEGMAVGRPAIVAFKADGATTEFLFPTDKQAISTAKIEAWDNGSPATITPATDGITFSIAPASGHIIVVFYEY